MESAGIWDGMGRSVRMIYTLREVIPKGATANGEGF